MCHSAECPYEDLETGYCTIKIGDPFPDDSACNQKEKDYERIIIRLGGEPHEI